MIPMLYDLTIETGMPHLEENLRYATRHERRCLGRDSLFTAFPILDHPALSGCTLRDPVQRKDLVTYTLICDRGHGTTGQAVWRLSEHHARGTLNVKLGGKNMTFYQRITATVRGTCSD